MYGTRRHTRVSAECCAVSRETGDTTVGDTLLTRLTQVNISADKAAVSADGSATLAIPGTSQLQSRVRQLSRRRAMVRRCDELIFAEACLRHVRACPELACGQQLHLQPALRTLCVLNQSYRRHGTRQPKAGLVEDHASAISMNFGRSNNSSRPMCRRRTLAMSASSFMIS